MAQADPFGSVFELERQTGGSWPEIHAARERTFALHAKLQAAVESETFEDGAFVVFGSLGRFEVTGGSDIDWTYLIDGQASAKHQAAALRIAAAIEPLGNKPGREGAFGNLAFSHNLVQYIGGQDDTNANLTRRILLLSESKPIGSRREAYDRVMNAVLERYLAGDHGWIRARTPHHVPRFLFNDIARYWRTVAVDFAYKQWTRDNKGWALRSAKLRLSRKLIYAAGLLYCFSLAEGVWNASVEAAGESPRKMMAIERLSALSARTPLDILADAFLLASELDEGGRCFDAYDRFLGLLANASQRNHLDSLTPEAAEDDETYQEVRDLGERFQSSLTTLFIGNGGSSSNPYPALTRVYGVF